MKEYGGIQELVTVRPGTSSSSESGSVFTTPPLFNWANFTTPITNTQRKRGAEYIQGWIALGPLIPITKCVIEKVERATDRMIIEGQLSKELLRPTTAAAEKQQARKTAKGTIVQKYGEIYGNVAWHQMKDDDDDAKEVVNM